MKESNSLNPHLAKTEKNPQSKPFLKEQMNSDKGSRMKERPSVREKLEKAKDGVTDILVKAEDASKINRIVQRFNLARFDEVAIRGEIQKTKEMKSKGVKQKPIEDKIKEELHKNPIKKEEQSVNPHLAKTEKSPQSKPFLKEQKNSDKGSKIKERPSVREKLEKYKAEVKLRDQSEVKSEIKNKTPKDKTR